jgi:hypothetical protein
MSAHFHRIANELLPAALVDLAPTLRERGVVWQVFSVESSFRRWYFYRPGELGIIELTTTVGVNVYECPDSRRVLTGDVCLCRFACAFESIDSPRATDTMMPDQFKNLDYLEGDVFVWRGGAADVERPIEDWILREVDAFFGSVADLVAR